MVTYRSGRAPQWALRQQLRELAARVSFGYRRLHTLLRRQGWPVNLRLIYRLHGAEHLLLRRKRPRLRRSAVPLNPIQAIWNTKLGICPRFGGFCGRM